jgi:hypothetical protein
VTRGRDRSRRRVMGGWSAFGCLSGKAVGAADKTNSREQSQDEDMYEMADYSLMWFPWVGVCQD